MQPSLLGFHPPPSHVIVGPYCSSINNMSCQSPAGYGSYYQHPRHWQSLVLRVMACAYLVDTRYEGTGERMQVELDVHLFQRAVETRKKWKKALFERPTARQRLVRRAKDQVTTIRDRFPTYSVIRLSPIGFQGVYDGDFLLSLIFAERIGPETLRVWKLRR